MSSWNKSTPRVNTNRNTYVTVVIKGGLGNRIFQVLAAQHFAEKTGRNFIIHNDFIKSNPHETPEDTMNQLMQIFPSLTFYTGNPLNWAKIEEEAYMMFQYQPDIFKRFPGRNILLEGYFQNLNYFPKELPYFQESNRYSNYFLHIRLGDYVNTHFDIDLRNYYKSCITKILKDNSAIQFLVFSNEPEKAEEYLKSLNIPLKYSFSSANSSLSVLKGMGACSGGICANSSLSILGAFFQKPRGQIFMPNKWIKGISRNQLNGFYPLWATLMETKAPTPRL
jgi:hypothetical protein